MIAYYNEIDPQSAAWLRELIKNNLIARGHVDERSIEDVTPSDLIGYTQCHFFAGIGGWSLALRLAGWPDDRPVWSGSCPCQPFSQAGKGVGFADERHLWPSWHWLISQCRPAAVFGEQVTSGVAVSWLDLVSTDLEGLGYAFGSVSIPACSVGAPHLRQRAFWVADSIINRLQGRVRRRQDQAWEVIDGPSGCDSAINPWADTECLQFRDGKSRPIEPETFPLAHGVPGRVELLRGYGNAIVPQVAAKFIQSVM